MTQLLRRNSLAQNGEEEREFPFSMKEFKYLASLVYERSGIVLGDNKKNMVYSRLARRLRELKLGSFSEYCQLVSSPQGSDEIGTLINAITTNLTKFFREVHHFDHLRDEVLRPMINDRSSRRLRIWSAACSSGEEPHSIAITLAEALPDIAQWDARILASDLDTKMVATGKAGIYPEGSFSDMPATIKNKYFNELEADKEKTFQADNSIRKLITFKHLNLLGSWPMKGPFDAIFCRNVMIYFDNDTKNTLVKRFAKLLKPQGWLYIGHSESLLDVNSIYGLAGRTIYRKL